MTSKNQVPAILERLKALQKKPMDWLAWGKAADEIAEALNLQWEPALTLLHGPCATNLVRWLDRQGEIVDEFEYVLAKFGTEAVAFVNTTDLREQLAEWSRRPQPELLKARIVKMIADGVVPGRTRKWKEIFRELRDSCNGWLGDGRPARGFGDRQIQRVFKELGLN
jgi:hypothetical protein